MRRRAFAILLSTVFTGGCLRTASQDSPADTNGGATGTPQGGGLVPADSSSLSLQGQWQAPYPISLIDSHDRYEQSVLVGEPGSSFARLSLADGSAHWEQSVTSVPASQDVTTRSTRAGSTLLVGGHDHIYGLDVDTGSVIWETPIPTQTDTLRNLETQFITMDETALCSFSYETPSGEQRAGLAGLTPLDGTIQWSKTHDELRSREFLQDEYAWRVVTSISPPIKGRSIVASQNTAFWLDIETGTVGAELQSGGQFQAVRSGSQLYLTDITGRLSAYDINDGGITEAWEFQPFGRASSPPTVHDGCVYFGADDNGIYAIEDGERRWRLKTESTVRVQPAVTDTAVWAVDNNGLLYCIDRADGTGMRITPETAPNSAPRAISFNDGRLLVTDSRQTLAYTIT